MWKTDTAVSKSGPWQPQMSLIASAMCWDLKQGADPRGGGSGQASGPLEGGDFYAGRGGRPAGAC